MHDSAKETIIQRQTSYTTKSNKKALAEAASSQKRNLRKVTQAVAMSVSQRQPR